MEEKEPRRIVSGRPRHVESVDRSIEGGRQLSGREIDRDQVRHIEDHLEGLLGYRR